MRTIRIVSIALLVAGIAFPALRGEEAGERVAVPFSDPAKPGKLEVSMLNGSIFVKGYDGKEVIVESRSRGGIVSPAEPSASKHPGMKRLSAGGSSLRIEEQGNVMEVSAPAWKSSTDLTIQVPRSTALELHTVNGGEIRVEDVGGEIEAANVNGSIVLLRLSGAVAAHTVNGKVSAGFSRLNGKTPLSLATLNGDVEIILPADAKADLKMRIDNEGDIYSDFDLAVQTKTDRSVEDERDLAVQSKTEHSSEYERHRPERGGRYHLSIERNVFAALNGGGQEITLKTFNGDILLRKAK